MKLSKLFSQTRRETPADSEIASHQLLVRAGYIRQLGAGIFSHLPLGRRSMHKIEEIMRQEIDAIGGQEIKMAVVNPAELWKETGRWSQIGAEMERFKDRAGHDMVLAMTHEEIVTDLIRSEIHSYRQLPALVYHIQTKWRDESRPRGGLIRVREFTMLDSYSLDADWQGLDQQYQAHLEAYFKIFQRCGLQTVAVEADTGVMGGKMAHEFMYLTPIGEDTLLFCDSCGYSANRQVATVRKPVPENEQPKPVEKVATPHTKSIEDLALLLGIPASRTAKAVFMVAEIETPAQADGAERVTADQFVFAVVRGDNEVNETKLANRIKARELRPATEEEIRAVGAVPGYASPYGLENVLVVVDDLVTQSPNLVAGANEEGYHLLNVNYGRDYTATITGDITAAAQGDACPNCGAALRSSRGVEVGNIFKLGTRYTDALGCNFVDENGQANPVIMGSYGIGVDRLLACAAEQYHDEKGLCLPFSIAPFPVHVILLPGKNTNPDEPSKRPEQAAAELIAELEGSGVDVLFDDRPDSPGIKFNDADLIGIPIRITVSERSLRQGGVELKMRASGVGGEVRLVPLEQAAAEIRAIIARESKALA